MDSSGPKLSGEVTSNLFKAFVAERFLQEWCKDYTSRLEASSFRKERFKLTIWPGNHEFTSRLL